MSRALQGQVLWLQYKGPEGSGESSTESRTEDLEEDSVIIEEIFGDVTTKGSFKPEDKVEARVEQTEQTTARDGAKADKTGAEAEVDELNGRFCMKSQEACMVRTIELIVDSRNLYRIILVDLKAQLWLFNP